MKSKKASETYSLKTELVLPNDTNNLGNLMGGKLLHWMDVIAAIAAQRASNRTVVTASVDTVEFRSSIPLGSIVILEAFVTRSFNSSMEVHIEVFAEDLATGERKKSNHAFYTFVAVDQSGRPIPVAEIIPETDREKDLHESALRRRELRLLLSGRMKPDDAKALTDYLAVR